MLGWMDEVREALDEVRDLAGNGVNYPHVTGANVTFKRAAKATAAPGVQTALFGGAVAPAPAGEDDDAEQPVGAD